FSVGQLAEYTSPLRGRMVSLRAQIGAAQQHHAIQAISAPSVDKIKQFAASARRALSNLSFSSRRAIVLNAVEKIVATHNRLQVHGYIPITDHVEFHSNHRHSQNATRHHSSLRIPFELSIPLPP